MAKATNEGQSLGDFNFDSSISFFDTSVDKSGITIEGGGNIDDLEEDSQATSLDKEDEKEENGEENEDQEEVKIETKVKTKAKKEDPEEDEDTSFFEDKDENEEDNKVTSETTKDSEGDEGKDEYYTSLAKEMKEKGYLSLVDIEDDAKLSEEEFVALYNTQKEKEIEEYFEGFFSELDEDAQKFLDFKRKGGNTSDFFKVYQENGFDTSKFNAEDEKSREKVIKYYLSVVDGKDEDEVEDQLTWLKESGKDKIYAENYNKKIEAYQKEQKETILKQAQEQIEAKKENARVFNEELGKVLNNTEKVREFSFNKQDQKELLAYISTPSVKVGKNYITPFQKDLGDIFNGKDVTNKQDLLLLAKLVKSGFDTKDLVKEVKKTVIKTTKNKIREAREGVNARSSGLFGGKKSLADFIDK